MGKFLFKWFVEVPAAFHAWLQLAAWILAGWNFAYMGFKGVDIHVLIPLGMAGVGAAALIGNQLPPLLKRWATQEKNDSVAIVLEELAALGHPTITTGDAAQAWSEVEGDPKENLIRRHLKFRKIKAWVNKGDIPAVALNGSDANLKTTINTKDLAAFFRRGLRG